MLKGVSDEAKFGLGLRGDAVQYQKHGVFVGYLDHSQSMRVENAGKLSVERMSSVRRNFANFCKISERADAGGDCQPRFFPCLGSADDIVIGHLEDLPSFSQTASWCPELVTFTLSLEPTVDSIAGSKKQEHLLTLAELFALSQDVYPLTCVTHVKLSGLMSLAFGGDLQIAAMEGICSRITESISVFEKVKDRIADVNLFGEAPFSSLRYSVLDPLAAEDIVIVFRCKNYSAAAYLLTAIRAMTLDSLRLDEASKQTEEKSGQSYRQRLGNSWNQESTRSIQKDFAKVILGSTAEEPLFSQLGGSNLFISTYTSLALGPSMVSEPVFSPKAMSCTGKVAVMGFADVSPGYTSRAEKQLRSLNSSVDELEEVTHLNASWRYVLPGRHDQVFTTGETEGNVPLHLISTEAFLGKLTKLYGSGVLDKQPALESGIQDLTTCLAVPVPRLCQGGDSDHDGSTQLFNSMMSPSNDSPFDGMSFLLQGGEYLRRRLRIADPDHLDSKLRLAGVSSASRSSVVLLMGEFCVAVEDPLLFDSVIDLLDPFLAISDFVCQSLPNLLRTSSPQTRSNEEFNNRTLLIEAVEGLRNAFYLRTERAAAKRDDRDTRVQAKGSLNNLLACADTALKCGIGLLRHTLFPGQQNSSYAKSKFCGIISPQLNSKSTVHVGYLPRQQHMSVAVIHADAAHFFHPEHLVRLLHELAHLFFEVNYCGGAKQLATLLLMRGSTVDFGSDSIAIPLYAWYSELFADWFVNVFAFPGDFDTFLQSTLLNFDALLGELQIDSMGFNRTEMPIDKHLELNLVDLLFRLYLMSSWHDRYWMPSYSTWRNSPDKTEINSNQAEFTKFARRHIRATTIGQRLSRISLEGYVDAVWKARSSDIDDSFEIVGQKVIELCLNYYTSVDLKNPGFARRVVQEGLEARIVLDTSLHDEVHEEFTMVFGIVAYYIRSLVGRNKNGRRSSAKFDPTDGDFSYEDRTEREQHNELYAIVIKSLWQISTRQRLRRLLSLTDERQTSSQQDGM